MRSLAHSRPFSRELLIACTPANKKSPKIYVSYRAHNHFLSRPRSSTVSRHTQQPPSTPRIDSILEPRTQTSAASEKRKGVCTERNVLIRRAANAAACCLRRRRSGAVPCSVEVRTVASVCARSSPSPFALFQLCLVRKIMRSRFSSWGSSFSCVCFFFFCLFLTFASRLLRSAGSTRKCHASAIGY